MWAVPEQHLVLHRGDFCRHCFENRWEIPLDIFFRTPKKSQAVGPELTCLGCSPTPWTLAGNSVKEDVPYTLSYPTSVENKILRVQHSGPQKAKRPLQAICCAS